MNGETLQQLASGLTDQLVYVAIGLVTLVGIIKCIYPVARNSSLLNHGVMKLEKSAADGDRPVWREARFLGRALRADWQRFLLNAGQLDLRGMPCSTEDYINEDTVIYKPGHAQLAELIPSLLTSLGILGTFIGLMQGLSNLDLSNAADTISSIPELLSGMRFAFATSVAGITCSLAFNMCNRIAVGHAFKALDSFDEAFYELAMPRPLDADVQMICQKQDDEMNLQRAADRVGSQLAGNVEVAISRAIHPLTMSIDNFIQGTSREQVEGIQRIVGQFIQQMNASMNGQISALAETMTMVNQSQQATQENLRRTLALAESLVEDAKRIQQSSHAFADAMDPEAQTLSQEKQAELLDLLRTTVARQEEMTQNLNDTQNDTLQTLSAIRNRLENEQTLTSDVLSQKLDELNETLRDTRDALESLNAVEPVKGAGKFFTNASEGA